MKEEFDDFKEIIGWLDNKKSDLGLKSKVKLGIQIYEVLKKEDRKEERIDNAV